MTTSALDALRAQLPDAVRAYLAKKKSWDNRLPELVALRDLMARLDAAQQAEDAARGTARIFNDPDRPPTFEEMGWGHLWPSVAAAEQRAAREASTNDPADIAPLGPPPPDVVKMQHTLQLIEYQLGTLLAYPGVVTRDDARALIGTLRRHAATALDLADPPGLETGNAPL